MKDWHDFGTRTVQRDPIAQNNYRPMTEDRAHRNPEVGCTGLGRRGTYWTAPGSDRPAASAAVPARRPSWMRQWRAGSAWPGWRSAGRAAGGRACRPCSGRSSGGGWELPRRTASAARAAGRAASGASPGWLTNRTARGRASPKWTCRPSAGWSRTPQTSSGGWWAPAARGTSTAAYWRCCMYTVLLFSTAGSRLFRSSMQLSQPNLLLPALLLLNSPDLETLELVVVSWTALSPSPSAPSGRSPLAIQPPSPAGEAWWPSRRARPPLESRRSAERQYGYRSVQPPGSQYPCPYSDHSPLPLYRRRPAAR